MVRNRLGAAAFARLPLIVGMLAVCLLPLSGCAEKGVAPATAAPTTSPAKAKLTAVITTDIGKVNAVCTKAASAAPIFVPIAEVIANLVAPGSGLAVADADAAGVAACAGVSATYAGLQTAPGAAATVTPVVATTPPPTQALVPGN